MNNIKIEEDYAYVTLPKIQKVGEMGGSFIITDEEYDKIMRSDNLLSLIEEFGGIPVVINNRPSNTNIYILPENIIGYTTMVDIDTVTIKIDIDKFNRFQKDLSNVIKYLYIGFCYTGK